MTDFNPQQLHIGRALKTHRQYLGVSDLEMNEAIKPNTYFEVRFVENAQRAALRGIRWYHDAVMRAYTTAATPRDTTVGEREQWWSDGFDHYLWDEAVRAHRGVHWWWNPRVTQRGAGAYCYLHDALIYTYDIGRGLTHNVRLAVMEHRAEHYLSAPAGSQPSERRKRA